MLWLLAVFDSHKGFPRDGSVRYEHYERRGRGGGSVSRAGPLAGRSAPRAHYFTRAACRATRSLLVPLRVGAAPSADAGDM